ncbi:MAG TPA: response regulator [Polyangiaceae bacterium]|nr:response regulator [Polyangiaceae bacterium]
MMNHILLIDDNEANRVTLSALLETEDFVVTQASSMAEARGLLTTASSFDLILLDRHLRDGLGVELIPVIRSRLPKAKIIVISGCSSAAEGNVAEDTDGVFGKGEHLDGLLDKIHALLS